MSNLKSIFNSAIVSSSPLIKRIMVQTITWIMVQTIRICFVLLNLN